MATLYLAFISINQLFGPVLSRIALKNSGEIETGSGQGSSEPALAAETAARTP